MSDLDTFMAQVQQNIKLLSSPNANVRRKAATWLGESGDPSAITRLKQVYEEDPDAGVRRAAAYSLGMFRALEQGMSSEDNDLVYERLEDIALRGKMGRRVPIRLGCLTRLLVALLVSLAILLAFNFVVWPQYQDQILDILGLEPLADPAAAAISDLLLAIREDTTLLHDQYSDPAALECGLSFNNPIVYMVENPDNQPELAGIANRLNGQLALLAVARAPYLQACSPDSSPLTEAAAAVPLASLETIQAELDAIEADLAAVRG
jgi:hypothetical protein